MCTISASSEGPEKHHSELCQEHDAASPAPVCVILVENIRKEVSVKERRGGMFVPMGG